MEAPRIQYAKTSDEVNIAYWTLGKGPPLVIPPLLFASHAQLEWNNVVRRSVYQFLAKRATVVRYDCRGIGASDRDHVDFSVEAAISDLEAVVQRLKLDRFAIVSQPTAGAVAVNYARLNPGRVTHLIHRIPAHEGESDRLASIAARLRRIGGFIEDDWELYSEIAARIVAGWNARIGTSLAELIRASHTPASFGLSVDATFGLESVFPTIESSTLLLYGIGQEGQAAAARRIAGTLPDAHVMGVPDHQIGLYTSSDATLDAVLDFMNATGAPDDRAIDDSGLRDSGMTTSDLSAILFTDIVDSTGLTERMGDGAFRDKAWQLDTTLRAIIRQYGGTPIEGKLLGDGVLAIFTSARQSIEAALACARSANQFGLPLHLGLHAGDIIREETPDGRDNAYGGAVNIASRIAGLSAAGEVLVSDIVRGLARTSAGVRFEDRGEQALKGVGEAVRVWAVREGEAL